jgi:N,N'-diacetyllegionaminate synthase
MMTDHVTVIAEAGMAHGGDVTTALKLCDAAKEAGADIAKFQTYVPEKAIATDSKDYALLAKLALPLNDFNTIAIHCNNIGIEFCSTPDDLDSLRFLVEQCGVKRIKLGSGSLTYRPLVRAAFATGLPVILSTGMATSHEVMSALLDSHGNQEKITLLQCTSLYPTPPELVNLRAMDSLRIFGTKVGYSDHTTGTLAPIAAAAMGADVVEKHFMLANTSPIDAAVSCAPRLFRLMVDEIRALTLLRGDGRKMPSPEEAVMISRVRKGPDGRQMGL